MRRILALLIGLSLLIPSALAAETEPWQQETGNGKFVTVRIPYDNGGEPVGWPLNFHLLARYRDTQEVIPLSAYYDGAVFATVPATEATRPLEAFEAVHTPFPDLMVYWDKGESYNPTGGAEDMEIRNVVQGDGGGNLLPDQIITRSEAVTLLARTLGLATPAPQPDRLGYQDVAADAWYAPAVQAARSMGIISPGNVFLPDRPVTREELTAMVYRAFHGVGWVQGEADNVTQRPAAWAGTYQDADSISAYAVGSYALLEGSGLLLCTYGQGAGTDLDNQIRTLEPQKPVTRGQAVDYLYSAIRFLPVYPSQLALEYQLDGVMPVIDGSTSTHPYTRAVYGALFQNHVNHTQYPAHHSKSYASYQRLISGEADVLFAATKPSVEQTAEAQSAGVALEYLPIAHDAMVFFTNQENNLSGLTRGQIQDIYVNNAFDNWNQMGGPDASLLPYCRNSDSGSHALLEQYFLEGGVLSISPDILQGNISLAMSTALTDVAAALRTNPPAYALGYSVYDYYNTSVTMMGDVTNNQLKLLAVDGVVPSDKTIADGSYPLSGYNYLVLRADTPEDAPARRLAALMVSKAGQRCVENAGFRPLS